MHIKKGRKFENITSPIRYIFKNRLIINILQKLFYLIKNQFDQPLKYLFVIVVRKYIAFHNYRFTNFSHFFSLKFYRYEGFIQHSILNTLILLNLLYLNESKVYFVLRSLV